MPRLLDVYLELALLALRKLPRFMAQRSLSQYQSDDYCQAAVERQLRLNDKKALKTPCIHSPQRRVSAAALHSCSKIAQYGHSPNRLD